MAADAVGHHNQRVAARFAGTIDKAVLVQFPDQANMGIGGNVQRSQTFTAATLS